MIIKVNKNTCIVFDLDDTLYCEIDYLKSAFQSIARELSDDQAESLYRDMLKIYMAGGNAFKFLLEMSKHRNLTLEKLLYLYRNHYPDISLREGVLELLSDIRERGGCTGIITDGRGVTQRNKIKALGLDRYIDNIIISEEFGAEKPAIVLYEYFIRDFNKQYYYIGDNVSKDFITPKKLKWYCIGILDENSIHKQDLSEYKDEYLPHIFIRSFKEIGIV